MQVPLLGESQIHGNFVTARTWIHEGSSLRVENGQSKRQLLLANLYIRLEAIPVTILPWRQFLGHVCSGRRLYQTRACLSS
jgi:hypothetical protein